MKENREFDMLENADDRTVGLLSEVPVLTKEEKERMLKMSKKKLDKMNREKNITKNTEGDEVSGTELYHRPKWHRFASIAACLVLVGGIAGTAVFINRKGRISDTAPLSQDSQDVDFDYAATVEELFDKFNELNLIRYGGGVEIDKNITLKYQGPNGEVEDPLCYLVTDERFSSFEDVREYFGQYVAEPLATYEYLLRQPPEKSCLPFCENPENGALYFSEWYDADSKAQAARFILEKDENGAAKVSVKPTDADEMNGLYEKSYDFSVPATKNGASFILQGKIVLDDGKWKLSEYSTAHYDGCVPRPEAMEKPAEFSSEEEETVYTAIDELVEFDAIVNGGAVVVDENDTKTIPYDDVSSIIYKRVTDERFKEISDVKEYFSDSFTESFLNANSYLYEGNLSVFKEFDGSLYYHLSGTEGHLYFVGEPIIIESTTDIIRVEVDSSGYYMLGDVENVKIVCVNDNGKWKIDRYEYIYGNFPEE